MDIDEKNTRFTYHNVSYTDLVYRALMQRMHERHQKAKAKVTKVKLSNKEKLVNISAVAHDILFSSTSIFPFQLFPDSIILDRHQLTIIHRKFFRTANTVIVQVVDILSAEATLGPIFGSLHIYSNYSISNVDRIFFLQRADVIKVQRLIQGYVIANRAGIDCSSIEKTKLIELLSGLGKTNHAAMRV